MLDRVAGELGVALTPALRRGVAQEQLQLVLVHTRVGTLAATLFAVLLAWHFRGEAMPAAWVDAWIAVKLAVAAARMALARAYKHRLEQAAATGPDPGHRWEHAMLALLALDGLVWGLGAWSMMGQPLATTALVVASVDAVTCIATFGLQAHVGAAAAYAAPMLLLTSLGLAQRGDDVALPTSVSQAILFALQMSTARGASRRLVAGMLLRLQAQDLVAEKDAALRLAQQQSAARVQFLAKVSHELRTPLHGILGLARLLHLESREPPVARRVELIESSGSHLLGLINDLLDASRADAGRFTLQHERFELVAQVRQVAEVFSLRAADRGLTFRFVNALEGPRWVDSDAGRLRQVLHNLLGNALKFTREGEVGLSLAADGDQLRIAVHDTGPGIGEAEAARVFQPFHQVRRASGQPTDGVGLGLTIAREIAQAMGGDIQLHSTPGQGATFTFTAPLPASAPPEPHAGAPHASPRLPQRVLVAEDDDVNAMIVCSYLDKLGVGHERVPDGKQAVSRALRETQRPEAVLMDCRMPVLDGLDATREIRSQEATLSLPRLPIIALTATATDADRAECLAAGMDAVVPKPFTLAELQRALERSGDP